MPEWIKKIEETWVGKTTTVTAVVSLGFVAFGQITSTIQHHQQVKGAEAMMQTSCANAIYDCDRVLEKYMVLKKAALPTSQFKYNMMSLKDNKNTLQDVTLTELPETDLKNFQIYGNDLNVTIVQLENSLSVLKKDSGDYYSEKGETLIAKEPFYHVTGDQAQLAIDNLVILRDNFRNDLKSMKNNKVIANNESYDKKFEQDNYKWLQDSRNRHNNFLKAMGGS